MSCQCYTHIEASKLICSADQLNVFYIKVAELTSRPNTLIVFDKRVQDKLSVCNLSTEVNILFGQISLIVSKCQDVKLTSLVGTAK